MQRPWCPVTVAVAGCTSQLQHVTVEIEWAMKAILYKNEKTTPPVSYLGVRGRVLGGNELEMICMVIVECTRPQTSFLPLLITRLIEDDPPPFFFATNGRGWDLVSIILMAQLQCLCWLLPGVGYEDSEYFSATWTADIPCWKLTCSSGCVCVCVSTYPHTDIELLFAS